MTTPSPDPVGGEPGGSAPVTARTTREVLDRYNEAFRLHDPALLDDLISEDCVIEDTGPAPDGARREGGQACLARWRELAGTAVWNSRPRRQRYTGTSRSNRESCGGATARRTASAA